LLNSGNLTGCAFSGGRANADFPVPEFVAAVEFVVVSGVGEVSGLGAVEEVAVTAGALRSLLDEVDCDDGGD